MSSILLINDEEANGKIDIDELYERNLRRDLKQLSIFNKILNRVHNRIKLTARNKLNDKYIWFVIPEFLFGEPTYNQSDCIAFVVNKIVDNGFYVKYIHPNTLFVSWEQWVPAYVRNEIKKKTGKYIDEKGQVVSSKSNWENENEADKLENSNMKLFNTGGVVNDNKKQGNSNTGKFTPIDNYKPTGKFVYNPELFTALNDRFT